jgi:hypothetical protein
MIKAAQFFMSAGLCQMGKLNQVLLAAATVLAMPAAATTMVNVSFGGAATNAGSLAYMADGVAFTVEARAFTALPATLTNLSQLSAGLQVRRTAPGIGVNGGASVDQIDTNQAARREGLLISADRALGLAGLRLSFIDNDDTLQVYGVSGSQLVSLGYPGVIRQGLGGANAGLSLLSGGATGPAFAGANNGTQQLDLLAPTAAFSAFFFTTREPGNVAFLGTQGQGYRIDSLRFVAGQAQPAAVPEPDSWALLIAGFGLVGAAARRSRRAVSAR